MCPEKNLKNGEYYTSGIKLPVQNNYEIAYQEAVQGFLSSNINNIHERTGARVIGENDIVLSFLNKEVCIRYPEISITFCDNEEVQLWLKIILLHYLSCVERVPFSDEQITYKQISGGLSYYPVFQRRCINPIISKFNGNYKSFIKAAEAIGGVRLEENKYTVLFQIFPNIRITYNIWEGDDELPADGNVIFDSSISNYISSEDIVVLCNMLTVMMIKNKI